VSLLEPYRKLQDRVKELEKQNQILLEQVRLFKKILYNIDLPKRVVKIKK